MVREDRRNQEGGVGAGGPGLVELIGAEDEVFTEQGQLHRLAHLHQHLKAPLEKLFICEHRQAAGTAGGIALGNGLGIEIFTDHPLAGAGLFDFSDHRRFTATGPQGAHEIAGGR